MDSAFFCIFREVWGFWTDERQVMKGHREDAHGRLASGKTWADILSGPHQSMAQRVFSLMRGLGIGKPVANNRAMVKALE